MSAPRSSPVIVSQREHPARSLAADTDADWIALSREASQAEMQSAEEAAAGLLETDAALVIVPLGNDGQILWEEIPPEVTLLAVPPFRRAIAFCRRKELQAQPEGVSVWQWAHQLSATQIRVASGISSSPPTDEEMPDLVPENPDLPKWLLSQIQNFEPGRTRETKTVTALQAGLFLFHDAMDRSHACSQSLEGQGETRDGDYWHAILHRREPDFGNSKYWFRSVGSHPVFPELQQAALPLLRSAQTSGPENWQQRLGGRVWEPFAFVDLCEECDRHPEEELVLAARRIQWMEMLLLLRHCATAATAS